MQNPHSDDSMQAAELPSQASRRSDHACGSSHGFPFPATTNREKQEEIELEERRCDSR